MFCLLTTFTIVGSSQTVAVKTSLAKAMQRNGDIDGQYTRSCVRAQGGLSKAIAILQAIDLNGDGDVEYIVSGDGICCVGARRCSTWIYQKQGNGFKKIFGGRDGLQGDVEVLRSKTKGYRDIRGTMYSGTESFSATEKWNGTRYQ